MTHPITKHGDGCCCHRCEQIPATQDQHDALAARLAEATEELVLSQHRHKTDVAKLHAESCDANERIAFLESREVCTVAHDNVETCGYCQRDAAEARLAESVRMIEGYKRAGWLTNPAAIEQANDFIARVRSATVSAEPAPWLPPNYAATPRCTHCGENKRFCDEQIAQFGDAGKCCPVCEHTVTVPVAPEAK